MSSDITPRSKEKISSPHVKIHKGQSFSAGFRFNGVADTGIAEFLIKTAASSNAHAVAGVTVNGGPCDVEAFEDTTVSADGNGVSEQNRNRQSATAATVTCFESPTVTGDGTQLVDTLVPSTSGGSGNNAFNLGGSVSGDHENDEIILDNSSNYLIRVTNHTGSSAVDIVISLNWYEV